jgi:hypothetical protein
MQLPSPPKIPMTQARYGLTLAAEWCRSRAHTRRSVEWCRSRAHTGVGQRADTRCGVVQVKGSHSLWSGAGQGPRLALYGVVQVKGLHWCRSKAHTRTLWSASDVSQGPTVMRVKVPHSLLSDAGQGLLSDVGEEPTLTVE